tara:strand:- start:3466 stop:4818 length:1353 start_codon:yes stop_codon:yes gene_type:complete
MISPSLAWVVGAFKSQRAFKQVPSYPQNLGAPQIQRSDGSYRLNPDGLIEEIGNNIPRQDWDVNKGKISDYPCISIRQQQDNWIKYTQEFNNGLWQKNGGFVSTDRVTGPDGLQSAERFQASGVIPGLKYMHQNLDVKVNESKVYFSVWVRDGGGEGGNPGTGYFTLSIYDNNNSVDYCYATFDIINGLVVDSGGTGYAPTNTTIKEYPDKWFRVGFMCAVGSGSSGAFQMRLYAAVNSPETGNFPNYLEPGAAVNQQIQFWGANATKTAYPLPYIFAMGSFEKSEEDNFFCSGLTDQINSPEGLWFIHVKMATSQNYLSNSSAVISLNDGGTSDGINFNFKKSNPNFSMNINVGSSSESFYQGNLDFDHEIKLAVYYKTDYVELFYNGNSIYIDNTFRTFDTRVLQKIVNNNGGGFNKFEEGDIYQYRFYDVRTLTSSQIKQLQTQLTQ